MYRRPWLSSGSLWIIELKKGLLSYERLTTISLPLKCNIMIFYHQISMCSGHIMNYVEISKQSSSLLNPISDTLHHGYIWFLIVIMILKSTNYGSVHCQCQSWQLSNSCISIPVNESCHIWNSYSLYDI